MIRRLQTGPLQTGAVETGAVATGSKAKGAWLRIAIAACALLPAARMPAQISLSSAIDLALRNDPRIRLAQDDLRRAVAVRQEVKDAYLPSATANGGAGYTYGITLTVPTVFTLDAQSLIYSPSQRHYTAASRWELQAAQAAAALAREQVEEDVILVFESLESSSRLGDVLAAEYGHANALVQVVQQRLDAGLESELEWKLARRTAAQLRLQMLQQQDDVENLRARLGQITGLPPEHLQAVPESAEVWSVPVDTVLAHAPDNLDLVHARDQAEGRRERALADARGPWRPTLTFNGQYARVSPINNVTDYYNLHGRYNIFSFGAIVRFPFLDAAARARQREARADAAHALDELAFVEFRQSDDRRNLQHTLAELNARMEVAELDASIAADQLANTRRLSVEGGNGGAVLNPKDVEHSAIQERQRYADLLDATLQMRRTKVLILRQSGGLDAWVQRLRNTSAPAASGDGTGQVIPPASNETQVHQHAPNLPH